ncbi:hypothetical protein [Aestuariivirga sp.]|uniref:hypothetical protein n=1 Tax=Aestuariivirga sp. TaxID=2650926 RepID=UPI00391C9911
MTKTVNHKLDAALLKKLKDLWKLAERGDVSVKKVDVDTGEDHFGDPVIFVCVHHNRTKKPVRLKSITSLDGKVRDLAWEQGEQRFIHVRHLFDEKQKVAG